MSTYPEQISSGSTELHRLQAAMIAAGLATFAMLYSTQASLPVIGSSFGVGATLASLTVSVTTGTLALAVLPVSALAERIGRVRVMSVGLALACLAVAAGAAAPDLAALLVARAVVGLALGGVVAVAMGHIGDEVHPRAAGTAVGLYVSATSVGGLLGRLVPAATDPLGGWRLSLLAVAAVGAVCTAVFVRTVPRSARVPARHIAGPIRELLHDPGIVRLVIVGMLLMGGFVGTYNYLTFRLAAAPFDLSSTVIGLVFVAYLAGTLTSTLAGRAAARSGRGRVVTVAVVVAVAGLALTLVDALPLVLVGLVVFTGGFFAAHAVASAWIGSRVAVGKSRASALYLLGYYLGSSVGGSLIGVAWSHGGWPLTVAVVAACYVCVVPVCAGIGEPATSGPAADVTTSSIGVVRAAHRP